MSTPEVGAIVAKMNCNTIETSNYGSGQYHKVRLGAIYGKEGENAAFTKATPSGECWMQIDANARALEFFKPGKRYYVTFTEAPD